MIPAATRRLIALSALALTPVMLAVTTLKWPAQEALGFRTQISPQFGIAAPYTGALVITVDNKGYLKGEYQSDSIRPDPMYGRTVPVSGAISNNGIQLQIGGALRPITVSGTYTNNAITGTVTGGIRGGIWTFHATRVHLKAPPKNT